MILNRILRSSAPILFCIVALTVYPAMSEACTLWGATGDKVAGGGTIIAKNRDGRADQYGEIKFIIPKDGIRYVGLFYNKNNLSAGVNKKGLALISARASSIANDLRSKNKKNLGAFILTSFGSVDAVVKRKKIFENSKPIFYMIGDREKIAVIEVAPNGKVSVKISDNGTLYHTNHYLDSSLVSVNSVMSKSSLDRFNRIRGLVKSHKGRFDIDDFIEFSKDTKGGPDSGIWRTGSSSKRERTLASWIVKLSKREPTSLYLKLANAGESPRAYILTLDTLFWKNGFKKYRKKI